MIWAAINTVTACAACWAAIYLLAGYHDHMSLFERLMITGIAASMVLRLGPIFGRPLDITSPFDNWSVTFLHVHLVGALVCLIWRAEKGKRLA